VTAKIGLSAKEQIERLTVFDTGAGPNLIRADLLPADAKAKINKTRRIVHLSSASNHRLNTLGIIYLTGTIAKYTVRQPFVVVEKLDADVILGATYIGEHIESV